jgi:PhnB protein
MALYPYLNFGRNCAEAFTRYHEIFGGELTLLKMSDLPADDRYEAPAENADLIMHAALKFGDDLLMASDTGAPDYGPMQWMYVNFSTDSVDEAHRVWAALSDGATKIEMPLQETFWSPAFGVCVDRFGTPWMVSAAMPDQGS